MKRAVLYIRTSKTNQCPENQLEPLQQFCKERGFTIVRVYEEQESAWIAGHQREWARLMRDAANRHFDAVVTWSMDRISREGITAIFLKIKTLKQYGVIVLSLQESWLETLGEMADLFLAMLAWIACFESKRRSERTKAGKGKRGVDKKKRKTRVIKRPLIFEADVQAWQ